MLGSVSKVLLEAAKGRKLDEKPVYVCRYLAMHMDRLYLEALQVFIHSSIWCMTVVWVSLLSPPPPHFVSSL